MIAWYSVFPIRRCFLSDGDPRAKGLRPVSDGAACGRVVGITPCLRHGSREPGATVITDRWRGYWGLEKLGYEHKPRSQRAVRAREEDVSHLLPAVDRVASLSRRWLLGTHQGSVDDAHLPSYRNELVFRFNRRHSKSRGMVFYRVFELAVGHAPVRYGDIISGRRPRAVSPTPPLARGKPPSLEEPPANRPWRS
ncbi:transposase [Stutzerimonas stutzeri]|uniref:transposase n=1 Tax=Stutzerimonas stutzeri TaxID=316 RepID=UPI003C6FF23D